MTSSGASMFCEQWRGEAFEPHTLTDVMQAKREAEGRGLTGTVSVAVTHQQLLHLFYLVLDLLELLFLL